MAEVSNAFLINIIAHNDVVGNCFCRYCRPRRLSALDGVNLDALYHTFTGILPLNEEVKLDSYHGQVISQIVFGEKYKTAALHGTGYRYFKCWAKQRFQNLSPKELTKFSEKVNEASCVYNNWDNIVTNLTDHRMKFDARRFSVRMFYLSKSIEWCLSYNDQVRKKGKMSLENPLYPKDKFEAIFQNIIDSGILDDIDHDTSIAASIGGRLQTKIISYCKVRQQPY